MPASKGRSQNRVQRASPATPKGPSLVEALISDAQACVLCERMCNSQRVLSARNGDWSAKIMFVGEAPGRLGAEVTGIPFFGDRAGDRFDELLQLMDLSREALFVSNAVLCNPRDEVGRNATPTRSEVRNCTPLLERTIGQVQPRVVVAMGGVALDAISLIGGPAMTLNKAVGKLRSGDVT